MPSAGFVDQEMVAVAHYLKLADVSHTRSCTILWSPSVAPTFFVGGCCNVGCAGNIVGTASGWSSGVEHGGRRYAVLSKCALHSTAYLLGVQSFLLTAAIHRPLLSLLSSVFSLGNSW